MESTGTDTGTDNEMKILNKPRKALRKRPGLGFLDSSEEDEEPPKKKLKFQDKATQVYTKTERDFAKETLQRQKLFFKTWNSFKTVKLEHFLCPEENRKAGSGFYDSHFATELKEFLKEFKNGFLSIIHFCRLNFNKF